MPLTYHSHSCILTYPPLDSLEESLFLIFFEIFQRNRKITVAKAYIRKITSKRSNVIPQKRKSRELN